MMNTYHESKLENGLSVITAKHTNFEVVTISLWIKGGSRYELPLERGYAHILEHLLLKETKKTSIQKLGETIDRLGAYTNAHTSSESISLHIQVTKEKHEEMLALLGEMITAPLFREQILESEKKAILEEWNRFYDSRGSRIGAQSLSVTFTNHPISYNPLGEKNIIEQARVENIHSYYKKYAIPNRSTLIVSGDIEHEDILLLVHKYFTYPIEIKTDTEKIISPPKNKGGSEFIQDPANQTNLFFNYICPQTSFREAITLDLITNSIGYGRFPLLKQKLRYKTGLVYSVNAQVSKFQDASLFYISTASSKPKEVIQIVKIVLQNLDFIYTKETLEEFKEQFKNVLLRKLIDPFFETEALWIYKKLSGKLISPSNIIDEITSITLDDIRTIKEKYLSEKNLFITAFGTENPF